MVTIEQELTEGRRFRFGRNWSRFLKTVDENSIVAAEQSLKEMLGIDDLSGLSFLDIGSGGGLNSLVARRLGASVMAFDFDPTSVACTETLRDRYRKGDDDWQTGTGSVMDRDYLERLGRFNIVYAWGVLHHTGDMWQGLANVILPVAPHGRLFIALYNDQGWVSQYWTGVKRLYNAGPFGRVLAILVHAPYLLGARGLVRALSGRWQLERGMSLWYDMIDWLGGYPFEVARPHELIRFYKERDFDLVAVKRVRRHGCNEFVFRKCG